MNAGLVPADYILGLLGKGPATRMALVGCLMGRGYQYDAAEREVGQAILALTRAGRIESFQGDVWRLGATAKFEGDSSTKAERATKATGGYKQFNKAQRGDDKTPPIGAPCVDGDGQ